MNDAIYYKLIKMYFHQCGSNTPLWLDYTMMLKWEMTLNGGY